jgi:hypothetical protein
MTNVMVAIRARLRKTVSDGSEWQQLAPYQRPGYKPPERMSALDYLTPASKWPLVWVTDIGGYDAVSQRTAGQASFNLSGAREGRGGVRLNCTVPLADGRLFDKEGTYVVVIVPAENSEQVEAILNAAGVAP